MVVFLSGQSRRQAEARLHRGRQRGDWAEGQAGGRGDGQRVAGRARPARRTAHRRRHHRRGRRWLGGKRQTRRQHGLDGHGHGRAACRRGTAAPAACPAAAAAAAEVRMVRMVRVVRVVRVRVVVVVPGHAGVVRVSPVQLGVHLVVTLRQVRLGERADGVERRLQVGRRRGVGHGGRRKLTRERRQRRRRHEAVRRRHHGRLLRRFRVIRRYDVINGERLLERRRRRVRKLSGTGHRLQTHLRRLFLQKRRHAVDERRLQAHRVTQPTGRARRTGYTHLLHTLQSLLHKLGHLESLPAAQEASVFEHIPAHGMQRPVAAFPRPVRSARYLDKAIIERQVVSERVLPPLRVLPVVRKPVHDELVNVWQGQHFFRRALDCHGSQGDVRVGRLLVAIRVSAGAWHSGSILQVLQIYIQIRRAVCLALFRNG